jgi:hypothetical protein
MRDANENQFAQKLAGELFTECLMRRKALLMRRELTLPSSFRLLGKRTHPFESEPFECCFPSKSSTRGVLGRPGIQGRARGQPIR